MRNQRQFLINQLSSPQFKKRQRLSEMAEKFSGGGIKKKLQRLFLTPTVYLPYLFLVKFKKFHRSSLSVRLFWGREVKIPLKDYDSLALYKFGFAGGTEAELKLTKYMVSVLRDKDIFYDIGANYGFFTYLAEEICEEVHSFEPNKELAIILRQNTHIKAGTKINEIALSDKEGSAQLHISESTGLSTINTSTTGIHSYSFSKAVRVETATLDSYIKSQRVPTFIKIDVEGAEEDVLCGARELLRNNNPIIAMEVWGRNNGGEISMKAVKLLRELGYSSFSIDLTGNLIETLDDLSIIAPANGGDNFIFKKKSY